jgi:TonB family protein
VGDGRWSRGTGPVLIAGAVCSWNGFALAGIVIAALVSDIWDGVLARRWRCDTAADPLPPVTGSIAPVAKANQESGTTEASGVFRQEPGIVMPKVTHFVEPSYTDEARKRKIRGTVRVEVVVEADGHLRTPQVLKSAADADSDPRDRDAAQTLDQKAIEAVSQYSFVPGTFHDKPVPIAVTVEVLLPDALIVPEGESGAVQRGEYSVCNEMDCWNHRGNHRPDRRILRGRIPVLRLVMAE